MTADFVQINIQAMSPAAGYSMKGIGPCFYSGLAFCLALCICARAAENKPFRAARSVHLSYPAPEALAFYNEVIVDQSVNGSYFMACGWNTGYFGIQQLGSPEDKVVLFSVWDPTHGDDPNVIRPEDRVEVLYQAEDVRIKRFGGEGTGGQCLWKFNWQAGATNRFYLAARIEGAKTAYTAWFRAESGWKKLATFRTRTMGKPMTGLYSFIEDFRRDVRSAGQVRRARFCNAWARTTEGHWVALAKARFTASNAEWESKENIDAGAVDGWFYLATGGDTARTRELKSLIELPRPPAVAPLPPEPSFQ